MYLHLAFHCISPQTFLKFKIILVIETTWFSSGVVRAVVGGGDRVAVGLWEW